MSATSSAGSSTKLVNNKNTCPSASTRNQPPHRPVRPLAQPHRHILHHPCRRSAAVNPRGGPKRANTALL